ncbi:MAG: SRPBCC family protein, partial [Gemmatimonadaceae bacterium]
MTNRSLHHDTFVIERSYKYSPERVYAAWADQGSKARWFVGPDNWEKSNHKLDFRVGGKESVSGGPPGGPVHYYYATYQDIVPNERIVTTYHMLMGDQRISVSVATVEFRPTAGGTTLVMTEQGVFLDGYD